jgi:hypothetical protein
MKSLSPKSAILPVAAGLFFLSFPTGIPAAECRWFMVPRAEVAYKFRISVDSAPGAYALIPRISG